jgi:hypothetical protein
VSEPTGIFTPWPGPHERVSDACPNCNNKTSLRLLNSRQVWPRLEDDPRGMPQSDDGALVEQCWQCMYCWSTCGVWKTFGVGNSPVRDPESVQLVWPSRAPRELPEAAPAEMRSLFREASQAENAGAMRGAAALYRAAVEALVADQNAPGRDLHQRIQALRTKGVEDDIVRDLDEARLLGNWSLHEGLTFAAAEVADVAELIEDAVELLYVLPARREEMRNARESRRAKTSDDT